jgi:hypothetical protein
MNHISNGDDTLICYYKHEANEKYAMEAPGLSCCETFKTQTSVGRLKPKRVLEHSRFHPSYISVNVKPGHQVESIVPCYEVS